MRPIAVYTLRELKAIAPTIEEHHVVSEDLSVKEKVFNLFWLLGCDVTHGIEVQKDLITRNRFGEEDSTTRFVVSERVDDEWTMKFKQYASNAAKEYTEDRSLVVDLFRMKNGGF